MKQIKQILLGLVLLVLLLPFLQFQFNLADPRPLDGDAQLAPDTTITFSSWFNSRYQDIKDKYVNDNFGFRSFYVRLRNELSYDLFNKIYAKEVVAGKNGFLYEQKYLQTHAGEDYVGDDKISALAEKIRFVQDTLEKKGIHFAVLFAPGKATFYPEYIPAPYDQPAVKTNYLQYAAVSRKLHINHLDYNDWFIRLKPSTKYPLYPQTGTHWSIYAMHHALDTLSRYIEHHTDKRLPHFDYSDVELSDSLRHPDGDIAAGLNLLRELPHFKMAYPRVHWIDTAGSYRPRVMTVSDSYWMGIYFTELPRHIFRNHEFWYYDKMVYNYDPGGKTTNPLEYDLKSKIESNEFIFVMATEASLKQIGWGFIEDVYDLYHDGPYAYQVAQRLKWKTAEKNNIRYAIMSSEAWYNHVKRQAKEQGIPLDSCMNLNIDYNYNEAHRNDPPPSEEERIQLEALRVKIRMAKSREWHDYLVKKAAGLKISLDSCMTLDAIWTAKENSKKQERLDHYKNAIRSTPHWLKDVEVKAKKKNISLDSAVTLDAMYMVEQELKSK